MISFVNIIFSREGWRHIFASFTFRDHKVNICSDKFGTVVNLIVGVVFETVAQIKDNKKVIELAQQLNAYCLLLLCNIRSTSYELIFANNSDRKKSSHGNEPKS